MPISDKYSEEFICDTLTYYYLNNEVKSKTCYKFNINTRTLTKWIKTIGIKVRVAVKTGQDPLKAVKDTSEQRIITDANDLAYDETLPFDQQLTSVNNILIRRLAARIPEEKNVKNLADALKIIDSIQRTGNPNAMLDDQLKKLMDKYEKKHK